MQWVRILLQVVFAQVLWLAAMAHAYPMNGCTTGTPAKVVLTELPGHWSGAVNSRANTYFAVLDAQGNPLKNVTVEFEAPEGPVSGTFGSGSDTTGFVASPTPRRVSATTSEECWGFSLVLVNGALTGQYTVQARVAQFPSITSSVAVDVVLPSTFDLTLRIDDGGVVMPGSIVSPTARLLWPAQYGNPYGGVPVTFSIVSGDEARFLDGTTFKTVISDPFGVARAPATVGGKEGKVEIQASVSDKQFLLPVAVAGGSVAELSAWVVDNGRVKFTSSFAYGDDANVYLRALFPWLPCGVQVNSADLSGTFQVWIDGGESVPSNASVRIQASAGNCGWETSTGIGLNEMGFGDHEISAQFSGNGKVAPSARSQPLRITVTPQFEAPLADGATLKLAVRDPLFTNWQSCSVVARTGSFGAPSWPAQPPPGMPTPSALFSVEAFDCTWRDPCSICQPQAIPALARRVLAARDQELPAGTVAWAYGPTRDDPSPHWYELPTSFFGSQAYFLVVDGGAGDDSLTLDNRIRATIALTAPAVGRYQDLWWAGPQENGWGLSLTQHRDVLFGELFIYDAQGTARWLAMPSGQWNAARTAYTGLLYRPRGTPYTATYDASQFAIGPAVGTLTLTPSSPDAMRLEYTIDGIRGTKQISRLAFGPKNASPQFPLDDLWWGGVAQNGWGVVVAQQYRSFFTLWYTYDENGDATWFVAPTSSQTDVPSGYASPFRFIADLYRPTGSSWIGAEYDSSRHSLEKVGTVMPYLGPGGGSMELRIGNAWRTLGLSRVPF